MVTLRRTKGAPLTHDEMDNNFAEIAGKLSSVNPSSLGTLTHAGNAVINGVFVRGAFALGAAAAPGVISLEATVLRQYVGDGTGYAWSLSKRSGSVTTDFVTVSDLAGSATMHVQARGAGDSPEMRISNDGSTTGASVLHLRRNDADNSKIFHVPGGTGGSLRLVARHPVSPGITLSTTLDGSVISERLRIDQSGNVLAASACLGYGPGAGGTAIQPTSKSASVVINRPSGVITMHAASMSPGSSVQFILNNSFINANDIVDIQPNLNTTTAYTARAYSTIDGQCSIVVTNNGGATLSDALPLKFAVKKVATS